MRTERRKLMRRVHAEALRLGLTADGRVALQERVTGKRSMSTMSVGDLQAVLAAMADPEAFVSDGPREPIGSEKAEIYLCRQFELAGRPYLAPTYDHIELWASSHWRRANKRAVARESLPCAIRGDRESAPLWNPDDLDRYVRRTLLIANVSPGVLRQGAAT